MKALGSLGSLLIPLAMEYARALLEQLVQQAMRLTFQLHLQHLSTLLRLSSSHLDLDHASPKTLDRRSTASYRDHTPYFNQARILSHSILLVTIHQESSCPNSQAPPNGNCNPSSYSKCLSGKLCQQRLQRFRTAPNSVRR
jgi:hypothetical protein